MKEPPHQRRLQMANQRRSYSEFAIHSSYATNEGMKSRVRHIDGDSVRSLLDLGS